MSREAIRNRGKEIAAALGLDPSRSPVPGLDDLMTELVYGGVWGRPNLELAERAICTLAVLSSLQRLSSLKPLSQPRCNWGLRRATFSKCLFRSAFMRGLSPPMNRPPSRSRSSRSRTEHCLQTPRQDSNEVLDRKGREVMAQLHGDGRSGGLCRSWKLRHGRALRNGNPLRLWRAVVAAGPRPPTANAVCACRVYGDGT